MAYCDYGAFVWKNGTRQKHLEDCEYGDWLTHGLITDGIIEVSCYKQGLPCIKYQGNDVAYYDADKVDSYWFEPFDCEINGYKFHFENCDTPYVVNVITPNGDIWKCAYDYSYGAGFEEEE